VLGCSHYPYLIPQIKKSFKTISKSFDSGEAVAKQTESFTRKSQGQQEKIVDLLSIPMQIQKY
jgi:glutamate racemase